MQPQRSRLAHMTFHIFAQPNKGRARAKSVKPPSAKHTQKEIHSYADNTYVFCSDKIIYAIYYILYRTQANCKITATRAQSTSLHISEYDYINRVILWD